MLASSMAVLVALVAGLQLAHADRQQNQAMLALSRDHGCNLCHALASRKPGGQEGMPAGPGWKDIAKRYRGRADSVDRLTSTVLQGTRPGYSVRHWRGKVSEQAMPSNAVEISKVDARRLVQWVLSLEE
jgi:cytochrome c